jgi:cytolysin-activating lysine-acyltransferase
MSALPISMSDPTMTAPDGAPRTVAEALGQITWLLSQSHLHRELKIRDLEGSIMPAILAEQFRIFRFGPLPGASEIDLTQFNHPDFTRESLEQLPLGVAIWAHLSAEAEARLDAGGPLNADDWQSGERTWLIELVSPFATVANKLTEAMLLDLIAGPFSGAPFHLHRTDPVTGQRVKVRMASHVAQPRDS